MKISPTIIISFLIISLFALTACGTTTNTAPATGFLGTKDGLAISFVTDEPYDKVLDQGNQPFRISLLLENKGEHDIAPNEVLTTLDAIDYDSFSITNPTQRNPSAIERVSRGADGKPLSGGKSQDISYEANYKNKVPASQAFTIGMNVCYLYETEAIVKACLRKDVTARSFATDSCKIEEDKTIMLSNSGAPVQVTSVSQRPSTKNSLKFVINIANANLKAEVYDPSFITKNICVTDPASGLQNKVTVKVYFEDNKPVVRCSKFADSNEGTLTLSQGTQRIDCEADTSGLQQTTFEKALNVKLDYAYKGYISKSIIIDRSL